jgi:cellulose synthase/poly-beta-1,6-N-acetylglucosamine synthase-like glycosyltransferase
MWYCLPDRLGQALREPRLFPRFKTKVTVLIAARNEEEKIHLTIEDILAQDYPKQFLRSLLLMITQQIIPRQLSAAIA